MAAEALSEAGLIDDTLKRLDGISKADAKAVIKALKEEIAVSLQAGYKVTLSGLLVLTPVAKAGRTKGTEVRNPFDGTTRKLTANESPKFNVKARVSGTVKAGFPEATTAVGKRLVQQLSK